MSTPQAKGRRLYRVFLGGQRARLEPADDRSARTRSDLRRRRTCALDVAIQKYDPRHPHPDVDKWHLRDKLKNHGGRYDYYIITWPSEYHLDWSSDEGGDVPILISRPAPRVTARIADARATWPPSPRGRAPEQR